MHSKPNHSSLTPAIRLVPGREKLSRTGHPWVFSGALDGPARPATSDPAATIVPAASAGVATTPTPGPALPGLVRVEDSRGGFVAWAQHNPGSKIALRLVEWQENSLPDLDWLAGTVRKAFARRFGLGDPRGPTGSSSASSAHPTMQTAAPTNARRLVFSEADHLPGLIVEQLGDWLVVQSENRVMDQWLELLADRLPTLAHEFLPDLQGILERSDGDGRQMEGLPPRTRVLWGTVPDDAVTIRENGLEFRVDLHGQKAGFYTDQRENRAIVAAYAAGRRVLDVCCYSGGFSVAAAAAGATALTLVDASADALELARRNLAANPAASTCPADFIQGDAFQILRQIQGRPASGAVAKPQPGHPSAADPARTGRFDLIILDPPKLAPTRNSLERALAAYKDLNLQALKLLAPGGLLASFSCSGLVSAGDLRQAIAFAAKDAGRQVQILHQLHQAPCHPILLSFPEGEYLKGFLLRVMG